MHVTGGDNRLVKLLSKPHNLPVNLHDILHGVDIRHPLRLDHKAVVAKRLYFQIVIKIDKSCDLRVGLFLQKRTVKLPRLAGAPQNQPLPVLRKQALGNPRPPRKVGQMGLRHKPVKIHAPHIVLRQNNCVVGRQFFDDIGTCLSSGVDLRQCGNPFLRHHGNQLHENLRRRLRVVHRPVVVLQRHAEGFRHRVQRMLFLPRQKNPRNPHRVHISKVVGNALPVAVFHDKTHVELGVVSHQNAVPAKRKKLRQHHVDLLRPHNHIICYSCQFLNLKGDGHQRIDKGGKAVHNLTAADLHRADLDNAVLCG